MASASKIEAVATATRPAQWLQPIETIAIGSGDRQHSSNARGTPDASGATSSAEQSPAPSPTKPMCHQNRVIAQLSRPVSRRLETDARPNLERGTARALNVLYAASFAVSADDVGQQPEEARPLDR